MTAVTNMHKTSFIFMMCHVMKVSCQSYAHSLK